MRRRLVSVFCLGFCLLAGLGAARGAVAGSGNGAAVGQQPPVNVSLPSISGTAVQGQTLAAAAGSWTGASISYSFQWARCDSSGAACAPLAGTTSTTYVLTSSDVGSTLRVSVLATNRNGSATATSAPTSVVAAAPITATTTTTAATTTAATTTAATTTTATTTTATTATTTTGTTTTTTTAPPPAPAPATAFPKFGIAASWISSPNATQELSGLSSIGAKFVRIDFNWRWIEQTQGSFDWTATDAAVANLGARGIQVLGTLAYTPSWANGGSTNQSTPPSDNTAFANFCKAAAARYQGKVFAWEIWNEPNNASFWNAAIDPGRYTNLLKAAYGAIKSVDPSLTVVSAGLSPYGSYGTKNSGGWNPRTYLEGMYAAGVQGSMDAVAFHPYDLPTKGPWQEMTSTSPSIRSIMVAYGDGTKQIWATEAGMGLQPYEAWGAANETDQATDTTTIINAWKQLSYGGPLFWFTYGDYVVTGHGLVRSDWTLRPAWYAYQTAITSQTALTAS